MVFRAFPTVLWISESLLGRHLPVVTSVFWMQMKSTSEHTANLGVTWLEKPGSRVDLRMFEECSGQPVPPVFSRLRQAVETLASWEGMHASRPRESVLESAGFVLTIFLRSNPE